MRRKKKIIKIVGSFVLVSVALFLIGCYTGIIEIHERNTDDTVMQVPINVLTSELNVQEYKYHKNEKNVEDLFFEQFGCTGFEILGYTDLELETEGLSGDTYGVYNVHADNLWHCYLIPEKDGASLPCVYEYNADKSLTLVWSGEW